MICPRCKSDRVIVQVMQDVKLKTVHHGLLWWFFVGWWWVPVKWIFFTLPALLFALFVPKRKKVVTKQYTLCVCQNCGNKWRAR